MVCKKPGATYCCVLQNLIINDQKKMVMNCTFTSYLKQVLFFNLNLKFKYIFHKAINFLLLIFFLSTIINTTKAQTLNKIALTQEPVIYINLMLPSADSMLLVDGTGAIYGFKFSNLVDEYDAGKLSNFNENISLMRNGQKLAIEARHVPLKTDTLFIHMWGMRHQAYNLQVMLKNITLLLPAKGWLVDSYLHTQTSVNLYDKTLYSFTPNSDTGSYMNRFMLVFNREIRQAPGTIGINNIPTLNNSSITIYPNPVTGNHLSLQFRNIIKDSYNIKVNNLSGRIFTNINIEHNGGNNEYYLPINSVYSKGVYSVTIEGKESKKIIHLPLVINN